MTHTELMRLMQKRVANGSVGPSTARSMGPAGTIECARGFLGIFPIKSVISGSERTFRKRLEIATNDLMSELPAGARHWGSSRKFINIFLRGALYNRYLSSHFKIDKVEAWLEVPLDSHVALGIKGDFNDAPLPRWKSVIGLTPQLSDQFQAAADEIAAPRGIARVHLDLIYWRGPHVRKTA